MLVIASINFGQARPETISSAQTIPGSCETNSADLNVVAQDELPLVGVAIAISRLGTGETSRTLSRRRLLDVKQMLIKYGLPEPRIVTGEGEKVKGYGRIELYVAGKLHRVLLAYPNKLLCVDCCFDPPNALSSQRKKGH
jgi:hypothetical protein